MSYLHFCDSQLVSQFLVSLGCGEHSHTILENEVNGMTLNYLCQNGGLTELGFSRLQEARIQAGVNNLHMQEWCAYQNAPMNHMQPYWGYLQAAPVGGAPPFVTPETSFHGPPHTGQVEPLSAVAWENLKGMLEEAGISMGELESLGTERDRLMTLQKSERKPGRSTDLKLKLEEDMKEVSDRLTGLVVSMPLGAESIFESVVAHAEHLCYHHLGHLFVAFFFGHASPTQQERLTNKLREYVVQISKDRWGTRVIQAAVCELPPGLKSAMVKELMRTINGTGKHNIKVLDDPNVTFTLRACLKSVVDGQVGMDFVCDIITALSMHLDELLYSKSDLLYASKLAMWTMECCSLTDAGRRDVAPILMWCSANVQELINHRCGNILLQHVVAYGGDTHRRQIASAALESLKTFSEHTDNMQECSKEKWFPSNVLQMCALKLASDEWFRTSLMQIVLPGGVCNQQLMQKLTGDNRFTARCIYDMAAGDEVKLLRDCMPHIDQTQREAKANYGFKASLFFREWTSFGATTEEPIGLKSIAPGKRSYRCTEGQFQLRIYGLPIPAKYANRSLQELQLQQPKYHILAFAMETDNGIITNVGADTQLCRGATLWVAFETNQDVPGLVQGFLGCKKSDIKARWLPLETFDVKDVPAWVDRDIESIGVRALYGITLYGLYHCGLSNVILFPSKSRDLKHDSTILVLRTDMHKLKEISASNATPVSPFPSSGASRLPGLPLQSPPQRQPCAGLVDFIETDTTPSIVCRNTFIDTVDAPAAPPRLERSHSNTSGRRFFS